MADEKNDSDEAKKKPIPKPKGHTEPISEMTHERKKPDETKKKPGSGKKPGEDKK